MWEETGVSGETYAEAGRMCILHVDSGLYWELLVFVFPLSAL